MMSSPKKVDLVVYSREECHLCQQMILALQERQAQVSFDLKVIDIDTDPTLVARYNEKIPVLMTLSGQTEICHHYLDINALDDYLAKIR